MSETLVEQVRWAKESFSFPSPEAFEERRGEKWVTADSRNHRVVAGGIEREVREGDTVEVDDARSPLIADLVEGRKIVKFEREPDPDYDWAHGENTVTLTLDDGAVLTFVGVGYDSSGCVTSYTPPN
jgi:hypothetical protein